MEKENLGLFYKGTIPNPELSALVHLITSGLSKSQIITLVARFHLVKVYVTQRPKR